MLSGFTKRELWPEMHLKTDFLLKDDLVQSNYLVEHLSEAASERTYLFAQYFWYKYKKEISEAFIKSCCNFCLYIVLVKGLTKGLKQKPR